MIQKETITMFWIYNVVVRVAWYEDVFECSLLSTDVLEEEYDFEV